jgi:hypothetical protein
MANSQPTITLLVSHAPPSLPDATPLTSTSKASANQKSTLTGRKRRGLPAFGLHRRDILPHSVWHLGAAQLITESLILHQTTDLTGQVMIVCLACGRSAFSGSNGLVTISGRSGSNRRARGSLVQ